MNSLPGFSILETFLIAIITPVVASRYIGSYNDFRKELIEARRHFRLYSNIYSNFYYIDEVSEERIKKINEVKNSLRIIWANIESKFLIIPFRFRQALIYIGWLPKPDDLNEILADMLAICNSTLIYESEKLKYELGMKDNSDRRKQEENIIKFINKYIK